MGSLQHSLAQLTGHVQVGFKSFLNITPSVTHAAAPPPSSPSRPTSTVSAGQTAAGSSFILTFDENPLAEFVELPDEALEGGLWFSNILCGVVRGALEMVCCSHAPCSAAHRFVGPAAGPGRVCVGCVTG